MTRHTPTAQKSVKRRKKRRRPPLSTAIVFMAASDRPKAENKQPVWSSRVDAAKKMGRRGTSSSLVDKKRIRREVITRQDYRLFLRGSVLIFFVFRTWLVSCAFVHAVGAPLYMWRAVKSPLPITASVNQCTTSRRPPSDFRGRGVGR